MTVNLKITDSVKYFEDQGKEIDWEDENLDNSVSTNEADAIQKILTAEVSYYLLRRAYGICGSLADDMQATRRDFINQYESVFKNKYSYPNQSCDF